MAYEYPVKYFRDNLIFTTNDVWAFYRMGGIAYNFESTDNKKSILSTVSRFIANIGSEAKIYVIPVAQDIELHYRKEIAKLNPADELYQSSVEHMTEVKNELIARLEEEVANDYEIYVSVKLEVENDKSFKEMTQDPAKAITNLMTTQDKKILKSKLRAAKKASKRVGETLSKRIRIAEVSPEVTQWLIKRPFHRGFSEVPLRVNFDGSMWEQPFEEEEDAIVPDTNSIITLQNETLVDATRKENYVKVYNSDGGVSYQAFLGMSFIPDGILFPDGEWLLMLQDYDVATEVCISIKNLEYDKALKKVERNRDEIKGQIKHVAENDDDIPEELFESRESSEELKQELKRFNDPLTQTSVTFCIAHKDPAVLERKVTEIRSAYKDVEFQLERGFPDQMTFFYQMLPGTPEMSPYVMKLPPRTLAASMFPVVRVLGDKNGQYIGTTGVIGKSVFLDPSNAPARDRSGSMAFLGTLGGGKSFNANLMVYLSVMAGGKGLIIDPKGERKYWEDNLPELKGHINVTTLSSSEEDRGKLDPFIVHRGSPNEAAELALNMMCELYGIKTQTKEYIAVAEAINKVKDMPMPSMLRVVKTLTEVPETDDLYDESRLLARSMKSTMQIGMASLIFGKGNEKGLSFDKRVNILQVQNIQMPEPNTQKEDYTTVERLSTVLMLPISSFAKRFASAPQDRDKFKVVILDESWVLLRTQMGKALYSFLARMGRSLNTSAIFIGHSAKDVSDEGIKAAITYKFCFRVSEKTEAKQTLEFLGLEQTDDNIEWLLGLGNGQCLFKDLDDNIDVLQFDAVHERLIRAFDTNPTRQKKREETYDEYEEGGEEYE